MTTDNFCFYLQNTLIQTSQTGGDVKDVVRDVRDIVRDVILPPLVFPGQKASMRMREKKF
jgi:hypothetical protein